MRLADRRPAGDVVLGAGDPHVHDGHRCSSGASRAGGFREAGASRSRGNDTPDRARAGDGPRYSPPEDGQGLPAEQAERAQEAHADGEGDGRQERDADGRRSSAGGTSRTKRRTSHADERAGRRPAEPGHQPEAAVLDGEGARHAAARGAERAEEHGLVEPLGPALGEGLGHHGEAGAEDEERDQPDRDRDAIDHARDALEDVADRDRGDVREGRRHALLDGAVGAGGNPGRREVGERRPIERSRREDHEEVRAERLPVHLAEAHHLGLHRHALDVEGQGAADVDAERARRLRLDRDPRPAPVGGAPPAAAGDDRARRRLGGERQDVLAGEPPRVRRAPAQRVADDRLSVDPGEARADDGDERRRGTPREWPRSSWRKASRLVRLHVDEEERGRLAAPLEVELAREPPLEERDGGEQRDADAERHRHPDRLAPGPGQGVEPLAPGQRARAREPSREPPGGPRGEDEEQPSAPAAAPRKMPPIRSGPACQSASAASPPATDTRGHPGPARPHASRRRSGGGAGSPAARRAPRGAARARRGASPGTRPGARPPPRRARRAPRARRGRTAGAEARAGAGRPCPRAAPARLPSSAERERLDAGTPAVSVRALGPEAPQDGDGADLPREERAHGGRHADAADEQARHAHQARGRS